MRDNCDFKISPIGRIRSPYVEKFAVPRQPGLAPDAISVIEFYPPYDDECAFEGLEGFSHIHLLFVFDKVEYSDFRAKVRPPRLGGNTYVGVFSTRSPFRPNRIGLSIVRIHKIIREHKKVRVEVVGADLVDKTPIIDIKPYIPFVDSVPDALGGFAKEPPPQCSLSFEGDTKERLLELGEGRFMAICESLRQDPRPAYKQDHDDKIYRAKMYNVQIEFKADGECITITNVIKLEETPPC